MNLNDILQNAQGGQAIDNLASQFNLSPDQAQAAVQAMIPAFSTGLQNVAANPGSLGGILGELAGGAHGASYTDPNASANAGGLGGGVLGQVFGSPQIVGQIVQQVSQASGLSPQVIQSMLPVVASILVGGLMHSMNGQGLGGILGQLASAATAPGGLGSILGGGQPGAQAPGGGGMLGGVLGSIVGSLLGGGGQAANPQSAALQQGLNTLNGMFQSGVQADPSHQSALNDILGSVLRGAGR